MLAAWPCFPCLHCSRDQRFASANSKLPMCLLASSLPKLLYNPKFGCFICIAHLCGRRHGENEPRSVGTQSGAHGMTVLLQVASFLDKQLSTKLHCKLQALAFWSPNDTLCPKARGLSPQHAGERAPCVLAAWPCFPCLHCSRERRFASANSKLPMCWLANSL